MIVPARCHAAQAHERRTGGQHSVWPAPMRRRACRGRPGRTGCVVRDPAAAPERQDAEGNCGGPKPPRVTDSPRYGLAPGVRGANQQAASSRTLIPESAIGSSAEQGLSSSSTSGSTVRQPDSHLEHQRLVPALMPRLSHSASGPSSQPFSWADRSAAEFSFLHQPSPPREALPLPTAPGARLNRR
jgi:hypothetical protein